MKTDARTRAERCFALARSTTFPAERATAIDRGTRVAEAAGFDLDSFDIPGRTPRLPRSAGIRPLPTAEREAIMRRHRAYMAAAAHREQQDTLAAALDRLRATMAAQAAATGAAPAETIHDARLRNFHRAAAEARARDVRREAA
jgi:hypothetical protein